MRVLQVAFTKPCLVKGIVKKASLEVILHTCDRVFFLFDGWLNSALRGLHPGGSVQLCTPDAGHERVVWDVQRAAAGPPEDALGEPEWPGLGKWKAPSSAAAASPAAAGRDLPFSHHGQAHASGFTEALVEPS